MNVWTNESKDSTVHFRVECNPTRIFKETLYAKLQITAFVTVVTCTCSTETTIIAVRTAAVGHRF